MAALKSSFVVKARKICERPEFHSLEKEQRRESADRTRYDRSLSPNCTCKFDPMLENDQISKLGEQSKSCICELCCISHSLSVRRWDTYCSRCRFSRMLPPQGQRVRIVRSPERGLALVRAQHVLGKLTHVKEFAAHVGIGR